MIGLVRTAIRRGSTKPRAIPLLLFALSALLGAQAQVQLRPVAPLSDAQAAEARKLMEAIRKDPRGPFGPIRWYCEDGRVLPPQGVPCRPGKGFQHAAPSPAGNQLAKLNFDVARFLSGLKYEDFVDSARNHHWLREMVLLDYLINRDDGWIYKRAMSRRGVRQAEDEEREARRLLTQLLADPELVSRNYLLVMQMAAVTPHGSATGRTRKIRALSTQVAEADARFNALRAKIHSRPGPEDLDDVEKFAQREPEQNLPALKDLITLLKEEYSVTATAATVNAMRRQVRGTSVEAQFEATAKALESGEEQAFHVGGEFAVALRRAISSPGTGAKKLDLVDAAIWVHDLAFRYGAKRGVKAKSRREHLDQLRAWVRYTAGMGLISFRQLDVLEAEIAAAAKKNDLSAEEYQSVTREIARSVEWTRAAVTREFGPVVRHYMTIEPLSSGLIDDLLRRSVALPLSREIEMLQSDAERVVGRRHDVLGRQVSRGVSALNSGIAIGPLEIVEPGQETGVKFQPEAIYVIPETIADLKPVAGILTLDSGNALSHAQLLAASLGIPNATVPSSLLNDLRAIRGERVFYAVTSSGTVVLRRWSAMSEAERKEWTEQPSSMRTKVKLDTARLDLKDTRLRSLSDVDKSDSGKSVGPKAANLGQLAKYFPGRIAPGIVIPFGVFYAHIAQKTGTHPPLDQQIREAYNAADQMRARGESVEAVRRFIYPKLEPFRRTIQTMPFLPGFEESLAKRMREEFGEDGSYGVFVRSDTNAEDLPEFSGAGLNLTVPNVVGRGKVMKALRDVWASPFRERAYDWRSQVLASSEHVLPSVLLLRTVAAEKSGVLVTVNIETLAPDEITVNVNEGVAAVVDGGIAESLLLRPDGSVKLLSQARSPYRRIALPEGGFAEIATTGSDYVLQDSEIAQLRDLVREVKQKYPPSFDENGKPLPWDIEFGFEKGQLRLFQIRPLVRFTEAKTLASLSRLEEAAKPVGRVRLDEMVQVQ